MKKQILFNISKKYLASPLLALAIVCFIIAGITLSHISKNSTQLKKQTTQTISPSQQQLGTQTTSEQTQTTIVQKPNFTVTPTHIQLIATDTPLPQATNTPVPQSTNTPAPISTVNIQINEPDGIFNFALLVGGTACDELTVAKNEGKIRSITFNDQYMSSMHSLYVTEINGYKNNWQFTVNGQGPAGCSLSSPKTGDTVVWKYN